MNNSLIYFILKGSKATGLYTLFLFVMDRYHLAINSFRKIPETKDELFKRIFIKRINQELNVPTKW